VVCARNDRPGGREIELVSLVARETRMQRALSAYVNGAADRGEERLDYVLIDCPPSLGLLTVNAFVAADEVFIPIQCEYYALEGLTLLLRNIELIKSHLNPILHVSTILLTMYDGRTRLSAQVSDEVRSHFPAHGVARLSASFRADLRGAQLRTDRDDLRSLQQWGAVLTVRRPASWRPRCARASLRSGRPVCGSVDLRAMSPTAGIWCPARASTSRRSCVLQRGRWV